MKKSDFHYELPEDLIAQEPLTERSASRLLVVPPAPAPFADRIVRFSDGQLASDGVNPNPARPRAPTGT